MAEVKFINNNVFENYQSYFETVKKVQNILYSMYKASAKYKRLQNACVKVLELNFKWFYENSGPQHLRLMFKANQKLHRIIKDECFQDKNILTKSLQIFQVLDICMKRLK